MRHDSSEDEDGDITEIDAPFEISATIPQASPMRRTQSTTSSESHRRFTAQEKGKGRAPPPSVTPEVYHIDSDSSDDMPLAANDSIQFIASSVAPSMVEVEDNASVIDEADALTAYSECIRVSRLMVACPVCFSAPTNPALTPW